MVHVACTAVVVGAAQVVAVLVELQLLEDVLLYAGVLLLRICAYIG